MEALPFIGAALVCFVFIYMIGIMGVKGEQLYKELKSSIIERILTFKVDVMMKFIDLEMNLFPEKEHEPITLTRKAQSKKGGTSDCVLRKNASGMKVDKLKRIRGI